VRSRDAHTAKDRPLQKKEGHGHDVSFPYESGGNPKTHPCIHQTRKDGAPGLWGELSATSEQEEREKQIPPVRELSATSDQRSGGKKKAIPPLATSHSPLLLCYLAVHSLPRARPAGSHPRKHRKFFMERPFQP
jgi:hypothetical protein